MKQKADRYEMHKYWGKKPHKNLHNTIKKYSKENDTVLDPFSGYGVFCCEAFILDRNVVSNDLNPISNLINKVLLETDFDVDKLRNTWIEVKKEFSHFNSKLFSIEINNKVFEVRSILRDNQNIPIKAKVYENGKSVELDLSKKDIKKIIEFESNLKIDDWYPTEYLIENSRISSKKNMKIQDLFTPRTLASHAKLFSVIESKSNGIIRDALILAFSSNLANCSKLVPPIKSRSEMSPGAWMTGFYIGKTYIENNVLWYYENRINKVIKGKIDYLNQINDNLFSVKRQSKFSITNNDAKNLDLDDNSIDYIFADPPYGDAVPYFEQSIIWNSWIKKNVDYQNEIVISNSSKRVKNLSNFNSDIEKLFEELKRVLKKNKFLTITYNSVSGNEWKAITNSCMRNGFTLDSFNYLKQKTFTPRQLNRENTIQGDLIITFKNTKKKRKIIEYSEEEFEIFSFKELKKIISNNQLTLSEIYFDFFQMIFKKGILIKEFNILDFLKKNFKYSDGKYSL